jgi:hypothetical protein
MKKFKILIIALVLIIPTLVFSGCDEEKTSTSRDISNTFDVANDMARNQPTPTDLDYSLERYNLIKRAYWVNGQREKAMSLPCAITRPLGYIVLFSNSGAVIGRFVVDGKVSSLNSWLTPDYVQIYSSKSGDYKQEEMPDVDGTYGTKTNGIFFFTTDGKYIEWTGDFLYSDIPFTVDDPVLKTE